MLKIWILWEKKMFPFGEKAWLFQKPLSVAIFFIECISNCPMAQRFSKGTKLAFFWRKIVFSKKILASFQKQQTLLISSRMCTKSYYCPRYLKISKLALFGKIDRSLEENFSKTPNFASFFQMRLEIYYCLCDL